MRCIIAAEGREQMNFRMFINGLPLVAMAALFPVTSLANAPSSQGKTANGCTYKIINGEYYVNCPDKVNTRSAGPSRSPANPDAPTVATPSYPSAAPGTLAPNTQTTSDYNAIATKPGKEMESPSLPKSAASVPVVDPQFPGDPQGVVQAGDPAQFGNFVYGGVVLGRSNFIDTDNLEGASTGFGVEFGTNVTEHIGLALGYSFQQTELFLGLEDRSGGAVLTPFTKAKNKPVGQVTNVPLTNEDSTLTAHIISAETQLHLTRAKALFRPFAALGIGYKVSTLEEDFPAGTDGASNSSMKQNSFGMTAGVGSKYKISDNFQLGAAFRFFIPVASTEPLWSTKPRRPEGAENRVFANEAERQKFLNARNLNLFDNSDTKLTESALSQLYLSVNYLF